MSERLHERNEQIIKMYSEGMSGLKIAKYFGIKHQRVYQILAASAVVRTATN